MEELLTLLGGLLVFLGIAGIVLPGLPDLPLAYAGLLLRAVATDFQAPSSTTLLALLVVTIFVWLENLLWRRSEQSGLGAHEMALLAPS